MPYPSLDYDELPSKRYFLELAAKYNNRASNTFSTAEEDVAFRLAASLLYMNHADYIAEFLAKKLYEVANHGLERFYFAAVSIKPYKKRGLNIGDSMKQIEKYEFQKKAEILEKLDQVNKSRTKVAHEMFKTNPNKLIEVDEAIENLIKSTKELIDLIDLIRPGLMPKNLGDLIDNQNTEVAQAAKTTKK